MKDFYVQCDELDQGCGTKYPGDLQQCPKCGASTDLIAIPAALPVDVYGYDIETYPNIFTFYIIHPATYTEWCFEISDRKNQIDQLLELLHQLKNCNAKMVGFNNNGFDYPVIHHIMLSLVPVTVESIYDKAMSIINSEYRDYSHIIWDNDQIIQQIDLMKIHHFDNKNKGTSLKALEFFMRMENIRDLPFEPGTVLNDQQKDELIKYNRHDVIATVMFWVRSLELIEFRGMLSNKYGGNFTNYNDAKIGSEIFQLKLEQAGIECYDRVGYKRHAKQTIRSEVKLAECIPDYIQFEHPEFKRILEVFKNTTMHGDNVKALFKDFNCTIDGITYEFGAGGQHASRQGLFQADDEYMILDLDVASMYPSVIIENNFYPEHLGPGFCPIFKELVTERKQVGKNTPLGKGLKLSANGTYGKLGDKYSFVYDLKTLLSVTLTGQLVLSMLVEQMIKIPNTIVLQTNTDGFTIRTPRIYLDHIKNLVNWWENITRLEMEYNYYSRMWLKNVNSYIAEYEESGKLKLKKDYAYDLAYHQDASALIVPKAIEAHLVHGKDIREFITSHRDPYDFCIRAKVPKTNKLVMRWGDYGDQPLQHIIRYYIGKIGGELVKIAPARDTPGEYKRANKLTDDYFNSVMAEIGPGVWDERIHTKNKSVYGDNVETGISVGWKCIDCSDMSQFNWNNLNYDYYVAEAEKLII
jgi:hypothetical protein